MPPDVGSASGTPPSVWLHGEQETRPQSALGQFDANRKDGQRNNDARQLERKLVRVVP